MTNDRFGLDRRLHPAVGPQKLGDMSDPRRIALLTTGGTIEKTYNESDGTISNQRSVLEIMLAGMVLRGVTQRAFYEAPIRTRVDVFGGIAMAWSSYTARRAPEESPFERGINCFQLARTADGWRIVSIAWAVESATTKLPADMAGG